MTPEQAGTVDAWIARLRSGSHRQEQCSLSIKREGQTDFGECCLGVLSLMKDVPYTEHTYVVDWGYDGRKRTAREFYYPRPLTGPYALSGRRGAPESGWFTKTTGLDSDVMTTLIDMNDEQKQSFAQIADYLEKLVKGKVVAHLP